MVPVMSAGHLFAGGIDRSAADSGTSRTAQLHHRVGQVALFLGASGQKHNEVRAALDSALPSAERTTNPSSTGGHVHITVDHAGAALRRRQRRRFDIG